MLNLIKKLLRKKIYYSGPYKSWKIAESKSVGYDSDEILEKVKKSAEIIKKTRVGFERDSIIYLEEEFDENLLEILYSYSTQKDKVIQILDYGGSLGSLYYKYKEKINNNFIWSIIEQKNYVDEGIKNFQNSELNFFYNIEEYKNNHCIDIVLISSSLQYLKNYKEIMLKLISLNPGYIVILKTPFSVKYTDEVYIQKPLKHIYKSTYPSWIFSYSLFLSIINPDYELKKRIVVKPEFYQLSYLNLYFKKKNT